MNIVELKDNISPLPYYTDGNQDQIILDDKGNLVCTLPETSNNHANAKFLTYAANNFFELVESLNSVLLMYELGIEDKRVIDTAARTLKKAQEVKE